MGRKGWAWLIIGLCLSLLIGVFVIKGNELSPETAMPKWSEEPVEGKGKEKILQVFIEGVIGQGGGFGSKFNSEDILSQLNQALHDETIKAVVIRVNTPGGEVVAADEIYTKILEVKQKGKPVVVSMGATAASAGYYISAPADRIFANPETLTGSLGVIMTLGNYRQAADWLGYRTNVIKSGKFKDIGNPLRELGGEEREILQQLVNECYQQFVDVIAKGRKIPREQVLQLADGRIYSGRQAKKLKLIDEFGSLEDATRYAQKRAGLKVARIVRYSSDFNLKSLFSASGQIKPAQLLEILGFIPPSSQGPHLLYMAP